jgi:transcriptional regulator with GAF, ATPase, and Fis domain
MPQASGDSQVVPNGNGEQADFHTDAQIKAQEKANMIAALRHANWRIWGSGGAAQLLGLKPSTLTYRVKVLGIRKEV